MPISNEQLYSFLSQVHVSEKEYRDAVLVLLNKIDQSNKTLVSGREPFDAMVPISATTPIIVDYRGRKYVYAYSSQALTLTLEDIGTLNLAPNTWTSISFPPGLNILAPAQASAVMVAIRQTDTVPASGNGSTGAVGHALTPYPGNPTQTAAAAADTLFKVGAIGTTSFSHVSIQNNTGASLYYAFDQSTTVATNQVYVLTTGQSAFWDRSCTVLHFSSAAQQSFGGLTGITVEVFA